MLSVSALGSWAQVAGDVFEAVVACNSELLDACNHPGPYETLLHIASRPSDLAEVGKSGAGCGCLCENHTVATRQVLRMAFRCCLDEPKKRGTLEGVGLQLWERISLFPAATKADG